MRGYEPLCPPAMPNDYFFSWLSVLICNIIHPEKSQEHTVRCRDYNTNYQNSLGQAVHFKLTAISSNPLISTKSESRVLFLFPRGEDDLRWNSRWWLGPPPSVSEQAGEGEWGGKEPSSWLQRVPRTPQMSPSTALQLQQSQNRKRKRTWKQAEVRRRGEEARLGWSDNLCSESV